MAQFDLVSDLHLDYWKTNLKDWRGIGTSLYCVVAGDVSRDLRLTAGFLRHLSLAYKQVIFVEGNHEYNKEYRDLENKEFQISEALANIPNLTYLSQSSCVIDGTAFVGAMGWWTFDFPPDSSQLATMEDFCHKENISMRDAMNIWQTAQDQTADLSDVVSALQDEDLVDEIVVVTHTVPRNDIIVPNFGDLISKWGKTGNSSMKEVLNFDHKNKISTWCFGHYHKNSYDQIMDGVRYISHPRGKPKDSINSVYYPKMIETSKNLINQN